MTINKCQGQTFDKLKYFFTDPVFHMDSCVAFSRARAFTDIKVKLWESNKQGYRNGKWYTRNVVI